MKNLFVITSGFILCFYAAYGWCDDSTHLIWESSFTKILPVIDGKMDEVWGRTKPLAVTIREAIGGDNPRQVVLRALHSDDTFYGNSSPQRAQRTQRNKGKGGIIA